MGARQSESYEYLSQQGIAMAWEFAETAILERTVGGFLPAIEYVTDCMKILPSGKAGIAWQASASEPSGIKSKVVCTDPPYYDNVSYADLSDFFYVWLRRTLRPVYPDLFATLTVPKAEEIVLALHRHQSKKEAQSAFSEGMGTAMSRIAVENCESIPMTVFYAFKQSELTAKENDSQSGWESFLTAIIQAGLVIVGTWPFRSEQGTRKTSLGSNSLASSVLLVCRQRTSKTQITRRQFVRELNESLPLALDEMTGSTGAIQSPVAPVDLSQAIIGPGMAVFSKYAAVLEADGSMMNVKTALQLINRFLTEDDFDADTQFCLHWFEQYGWETGKFGDADTLARAKGTSVDGVKQAGVLYASGGNVRLLKWADYMGDWDPQSDQRLPIWEVLHQLIRVFNSDGETGASAVFAAVQSKTEAARQLAYRLYTLCERKNWAEDARAYNELVTSWSGIEAAAAQEKAMKQGQLFE